MARTTIKELEQKLESARNSIDWWKEKAQIQEDAKDRAIAMYEALKKASTEAAEYRGKYEGFKEATRLFKRTDQGEKYEIDQRLKREEEMRKRHGGYPIPL